MIVFKKLLIGDFIEMYFTRIEFFENHLVVYEGYYNNIANVKTETLNKLKHLNTYSYNIDDTNDEIITHKIVIFKLE